MAKSRYIAIIEIDDDDKDLPIWKWGKGDVALWLDARLNHHSSRKVDSTVYDSITDLMADNVLDALAESG